MLMAYGYEIKEENDPVVKLAEQSVEDLGHLLESGNFLVEIFPWRMFPFISHSIFNALSTASLVFSEIRSRMVPWCRFPEDRQGMEDHARHYSADAVRIHESSSRE